MIEWLIGGWNLNLKLQTGILVLGKTAHLNSIQDMELKICTQNTSKKAATFQRREIRMYFNYEVINMQSIFFDHPLMQYVTLFRCSYIAVCLYSCPGFGFYFGFCFVLFFWSFNLYLCHLWGRPWKIGTASLNNLSFCSFKLAEKKKKIKRNGSFLQLVGWYYK